MRRNSVTIVKYAIYAGVLLSVNYVMISNIYPDTNPGISGIKTRQDQVIHQPAKTIHQADEVRSLSISLVLAHEVLVYNLYVI